MFKQVERETERDLKKRNKDNSDRTAGGFDKNPNTGKHLFIKRVLLSFSFKENDL